ncbi:MAG: DUF1292 domain-containing protein [Stomatobaculum sp.]
MEDGKKKTAEQPETEPAAVKRAETTGITVEDENGRATELYVLEETKLNGVFYLLAAESTEGDGACYLLKDVSGEADAEAVYEFVEDDAEAEYMLRVFQELMREEDVTLV